MIEETTRLTLPSGAEPTYPFAGLLNPERVRASISQFAQVASPLLRELVNYSSHAYATCFDGMNGLERDEAIATVRLHLHVIEMVDSVDVLLRDGCGQGAFGPARGTFEAGLSLAAIHAHTDFREASLAWLVGGVRREISTLESLKKILAAEGAAENTERLRNVDGEIKKLGRVLQRPHLAPIAERFSDEKWFRPLYGVSNQFALSVKLDDLARERAAATGEELERFSRRDAYILFYGRWSSALHGSDWKRVVQPGDGDGKVGIPEIRNQTVLPEVVKIVASLLLEATRLQVRKFRPDQADRLVRWYVQQVRERYLRLMAVVVTVK